MDLLKKDNALMNDEVLNLFVEFLRDRLGPNNDVAVMSTFFVPLMSKPGGTNQPLNWLTKLLNHQHGGPSVVVVPVNINQMHWIVAAIRLDEPAIEIYDSLQGCDINNYEPQWTVLIQAMGLYVGHRLARCKDASLWTIREALCPKQTNSTDCGIYCMMAMLWLIQRAPIYADSYLTPTHPSMRRHKDRIHKELQLFAEKQESLRKQREVNQLFDELPDEDEGDIGMAASLVNLPPKKPEGLKPWVVLCRRACQWLQAWCESDIANR
jgi:Ulp1 family protease